MQEPEPRQQIGQSKIQRPQTQNREHVRGIHNKRVARDRQDRRHRIHRENNVHGLDGDQRQKKWRRNPFSGLASRRSAPLEVIGHRNNPPRYPHQRIPIRPHSRAWSAETFSSQSAAAARQTHTAPRETTAATPLPPRTKIARITSAPSTPKNKTLCCDCAGTWND